MHFWISDARTSDITVQYSMEKYNSCYLSYLANIKSHPTEISFLSKYLSMSVKKIGSFRFPEISEYWSIPFMFFFLKFNYNWFQCTFTIINDNLMQQGKMSLEIWWDVTWLRQSFAIYFSWNGKNDLKCSKTCEAVEILKHRNMEKNLFLVYLSQNQYWQIYSGC